MDSGNETYKAYENRLSENSGYDVCVFYCSTSYEQQPRIKFSKHKEFADYNTRLKTFENCPKKLESKISTLCDAGFLYIGNGQNDQMLCYCCSQGLKDWDDEDDPFLAVHIYCYVRQKLTSSCRLFSVILRIIAEYAIMYAERSILDRENRNRTNIRLSGRVVAEGNTA
ncbi:inhibitor of apoptosis protein-like [Daktulosphaira vitifoliae]|uniref:inhibitor of apoptosis protein-like n=1 Tax=Daktulosphaira vitifoliae TaxID=58002 RepID=UPI0021AA04EC|nr:inhibitor of apoptosis protein-like [Daktulosphaira vitifoliae]